MRRLTVLALALPALVVVSACTGPAEPQPTHTQTPSLTPSPSATPTVAVSEEPVESPTPPREESTLPASLPPVEQPSAKGGPWESVDITLKSADDARTLGSIPDSLRLFLAARIGVEDEAGCTLTDVRLLGLHADGFAFGTEDTTCSGAHTVWGIADNQWGYIVQFGDAMPCLDLEQNDIPHGAPGLRCLGDEGAEDY
ncbi:MAG: hypothetical protein QM713_07230 [Arachnia sp.]